MPEQPRIPGGTGGGQFDRFRRADAFGDVELPEDADSGGESADDLHDLHERMTGARTGDHHQLNLALRDPSPEVRAEAAVNPQLTRRQHRRLARDQDLNVRIAAACRPKVGGADLAAADPSPLVRIRALSSPGLSDSSYQDLDRDPDVQRILAVISR